MDGLEDTDFKIIPTEITAAIEAGLKKPVEAKPEVPLLYNFSHLPLSMVLGLALG